MLHLDKAWPETRRRWGGLEEDDDVGFGWVVKGYFVEVGVGEGLA